MTATIGDIIVKINLSIKLWWNLQLIGNNEKIFKLTKFIESKNDEKFSGTF